MLCYNHTKSVVKGTVVVISQCSTFFKFHFAMATGAKRE